MTHTFDETLVDEVSQVRFRIADTIENQGPRPNNLNYTDELITALLTSRSNSIPAVVADLFNALSAEWTKYAISFTMGPRKEELYRIAENFKKQYSDWAAIAGIKYKAFSSGVIRRDSSVDTNSIS